MSLGAALPSKVNNENGAILTFVVPSPTGCDLSCPFCYIRQRGEDSTGSALAPEDYQRFLKEASENQSLVAVAIQGYEPLLADSFPYTRAILSTGRWLGLQTSLITNGTHLGRRVNPLAALSPDRISVSLDAATSSEHDRQRGKVGAFDAAIEGLRLAVAMMPSTTEIAVTSTLLPKRRAQLEDMPALLNLLGIKHWVVTALTKVDKDTIGGPVGERSRIFRDLKILQDKAHRHGIEFVTDDEFDTLRACPDDKTAASLRIRRLTRSGRIYRLVPNGQCSLGIDLLRELPAKAPRWFPGQIHAGDFLQGLTEEKVIYA